MFFTRYIAVRPETVVEVVKTGQYPKELPSYINVKTDYFDCKKTVAECFVNIQPPFDNCFILILSLPSEENPVNLDPARIRGIYVYSERGLNLLKALFQGSCPQEVYLRPDQFKSQTPQSPQSLSKSPVSATRKRGISPDLEEEPTTPSTCIASNVTSKIDSTTVVAFSNAAKSIQSPSKVAQSPIKSSQSPIQSTPNARKSIRRQMGEADVERIMTFDDHMAILQSAFRNAQRTILLTSYGINHQTMEMGSMYKLIQQAAQRGVKIYIYCNDEQAVDEEIIEFLRQFTQLADGAYTHSKILAVDDCFVAAGSFNWLSETDHKHEIGHNATIVHRAPSGLLIQDLWKYLKHYRNRQFDNYQDLRAFEWNEDNRNEQPYVIENDSALIYIPMLEQHQIFMEECFLNAERRVVICSPFISKSGNFLEDFHLQILNETASRGVDIFFVCKPSQIKSSGFDRYLAQLNHPKIYLVGMENIHLKSIVVDDDLIAEGSFNFLSAVRNEASLAHNHEVTFVVEGPSAKRLIEQFDSSEVGLQVQAAVAGQQQKQKLYKSGC